jgi:predicted nucleic acid-binding protein
MHCLDTNALLDYLDGVESIGAYLEAGQRPYFSPTIVLYEVFVGAARLRGETGVTDVRSDLEWVRPLPLTVDGAAEAALVDTELWTAGSPIGAMDTLIAGIVREAGATLVTSDRHFRRVDALDVVDYRENDE